MSDFDFKKFYRDMYAYIGRSLEPAHAVARDAIAEHERRLGIAAPAALIAYCEVAGGERQFNYCLDELVQPQDWYIDQDRLVFYEAHQAVVVYGIRLDHLDQSNPPVEMGNTPRPYSWIDISPSVSEFFQMMTYWQGVYAGAMVNVEYADVKPSLRRKLDAEWEYIGELNKMWCYRRPGQIACILKWDDTWRLHVGGATPKDCEKIRSDLGVTWIPWV